MRKRNIVYGLIALEIICIPVSAKVIDTVMHTFPQTVIATELPRQPGKAMIAVSSNKPFVITASGHTGEMDVKVTQTGMIYKTSYGQNAQMPGPARVCAATADDSAATIYTGALRTAKTRGQVLSQTVMVEVRYDASADPVFEVIPQKKSTKIAAAPACGSAQLAALSIQE